MMNKGTHYQTTELSDPEKKYLEYFDNLFIHVIWAEAHKTQWKQLRKTRLNKGIKTGHIFFNTTEKALYEAMLWCLMRLTDKHGDSLNITKFLDFAQSNIDIFSTEKFTHRQKDNPYIERWKSEHIPITDNDIKDDRLKINNLSKTVAKLTFWRDKVYGHIDRGQLSRQNSPRLKNFTYKEIDELINTIDEILRKYDTAFRSTAYFTLENGERDINNIIQIMKDGIKAREAKLHAKLRKLGIDER